MCYNVIEVSQWIISCGISKNYRKRIKFKSHQDLFFQNLRSSTPGILQWIPPRPLCTRILELLGCRSTKHHYKKIQRRTSLRWIGKEPFSGDFFKHTSAEWRGIDVVESEVRETLAICWDQREMWLSHIKFAYAKMMQWGFHVGYREEMGGDSQWCDKQGCQ